MKILCMGDLHIRETNPIYRIDNFKKSIQEKLTCIDVLCEQHDVKMILQPGDFFDTAERVSYSMLTEWIQFFREPFPKIYTIFGQHDLVNHSLLNFNTPLRVLEASNIVHLLGNIPEQHLLLKNKLRIYGCSYGERIPKVPKEKKVCNILVIHKMIIKDTKLWEEQQDYSMASTLLKKYNYDLIVSGDNHQQFIETYENKTLVNMGSLMRTAKNQKDHQPAVAIYDTDSGIVTTFPLPIKAFPMVFDVNRIEKEKLITKEVDDLVAAFEDSFTASYDFLNNLKEVKKGADADTLTILDEIYSN